MVITPEIKFEYHNLMILCVFDYQKEVVVYLIRNLVGDQP